MDAHMTPPPAVGRFGTTLPPLTKDVTETVMKGTYMIYYTHKMGL